jgi:hypothetical protein
MIIGVRTMLLILAQVAPPAIPQDANLTISWSSSTRSGSGEMNYTLEQAAIFTRDGSTLLTPAEFDYTWRSSFSQDYFILFQGGTLYLNTPSGVAGFALTAASTGPLNLQYTSTGPLSRMGNVAWGDNLTVTITGP